MSVLLENEKVKVSLKQAKRLREESGKCGGKLTEDTITAILNESPTKSKLRSVSLTEDVSERLLGYNIKSDKIFETIITLYLDMLERGEINIRPILKPKNMLYPEFDRRPA